MNLRVASWNINSVRLRLPLVLRLLRAAQIDVLCLQETKCQDGAFPGAALAEAGYPHQAFRGEKSYNGVAILSRHPLETVPHRDFCAKGDCRHVAAKIAGVTIHNIYLPAGGDVPDREQNPKFGHKLDFVAEMQDWFTQEPPTRAILVGDLNIAPLEEDVWSHKQLLKVVSHTPVETEAFEAMRAAGGWRDVTREQIPEGKLYSWWSYRARDWAASDRGRRLDHIWASADLGDACHKVEILRDARGWEKPSDHAPVIADFAL